MASKPKAPTITSSQLARYQTVFPLFASMHEDIKELSRKNQNAPLSKSRISMINRLLQDLKALLESEPTTAYLNILEEEIIPQNADALLIFGQFRAALDQFKDKYSDRDGLNRHWRLSD